MCVCIVKRTLIYWFSGLSSVWYIYISWYYTQTHKLQNGGTHFHINLSCKQARSRSNEDHWGSKTRSKCRKTLLTFISHFSEILSSISSSGLILHKVIRWQSQDRDGPLVLFVFLCTSVVVMMFLLSVFILIVVLLYGGSLYHNF